MYKETFVKRLREARAKSGMSQRQVEAKTDINNATLASYETGSAPEIIESLGKLADLYGVSVDWLLGTKASKKEK